MRGLVLLPMLLLAACHDEPSFDERYDKAAKEVEARAKRMDADIAEADRAAAASDETPQALPEAAKPSNAPPSSGE
ncbi:MULTISPECIES: hypothetical protein [unclassified Sphingopyxis]|uniref:hypothetical protein n=1 Tax=unclassified Sphingopyxis TaxID=2614943 RepID=UPI0024ADC15B|nr:MULTISPECIES: hypothetical protein [unclassified Sphingopyxis]